MPDDCVDMPEGAPALLVTTEAGEIYEVSAGGTQRIATSDGLPNSLDSAWRASNGTLWVSLTDGLTSTVGRLDNGEFTRSGNGSLQHVGEIDGQPVALWIEFGSASNPEGRVVIEQADGSQHSVGPATTGLFRAATGGIGGDRAAIHLRGPSTREDFRYYTGDGTERDDWLDPTERHANDDAVELTGPTPSPDGTRLAWLEEGHFLPVPGADIRPRVVIADLPSGGNRDVIAIAERRETIRTFDFDGRWYAASVIGTDAAPDRIVLVDTEARRPEAIVPCVPIGAVSIDRSGGGGSDGREPPDSTPGSSPGRRGETGPGGIDP